MRTRGVALQVTPDASQRSHGNTVGDREKAGGPLRRPPFVGRPVFAAQGMLGERGRLPPTTGRLSVISRQKWRNKEPFQAQRQIARSVEFLARAALKREKSLRLESLQRWRSCAVEHHPFPANRRESASRLAH